MTVNTAKVVRFYELGPASVLKLEEDSLPEPAENEVRIKVNAIGINRAEVMFRNGQYLETPVLPSRNGYEASGVIDKLGPNVDSFALGDEVSSIPAFSMSKYGVYGEYAVVPTRVLSRNPKGFTHIQSAAIWMQYITSYGALVEIGGIKAGDTVLITAASSSVGVATIHLAKVLGATVIACTRDESKKDFLISQGADHVVITRDSSLSEQALKITEQKGVNLCFDPIGGPIVNELAEACAIGGIIVEYGALSSEATPYPLFHSLAKGLTMRGYTLFELTQDDERLNKATDFLMDKFENSNLKPTIDKIFSLDQIVEAHEYMESNVQKGKIVIQI